MAVVVAMVAVFVMQMVPDQVIRVVAVRHRLVAAARTVAMGRVMLSAAMTRRAGIGVGLADLQHVLVHVVAVQEVQVTVVQVADVVAMPDRGVAALGRVQVVMLFMAVVLHGASRTPGGPGLRTYPHALGLTSPVWIPRRSED